MGRTNALPGGLGGGDDDVLHEAGEALVEPQLVPPLHRHQVAEPLVRQLVRDHLFRSDRIESLANQFESPHLGRLLHVLGGRLADVVEQQYVAVGDEAPVLHGALRELRHRDHVCILIFGNLPLPWQVANSIGGNAPTAFGHGVLDAEEVLQVVQRVHRVIEREVDGIDLVRRRVDGQLQVARRQDG